MKKYTWVAFIAFLALGAQADIASWQALAAGTAGNVVADGTSRTFDGSTGIEYDYGNLDEDGNFGSIGAGATVEYIFNITDSGTTMAFGAMEGWNGEQYVLKLEQWNNLGIYGITAPGVTDNSFTGAPSTFDADTHAVFVTRTDGRIELFINGTSMGVDDRAAGWVSNGSGVTGFGTLGGDHRTNIDVCTGTIYAVGTYNRALTATEIGDLYAAIPEPATFGMVAVFGGGIFFLRRKMR